MGTIIENINALSKIKYDLKNVLVDNGQRGGEVFSEYPEQFRDLFRVLEDYVDHTNMGYSPQALNVQGIIPTPEMYYDENIVFIHCDMQQATIKYWIVTESGKNNQGETTLKGNTIMVTEACTVYCYASYRSDTSATAELFVPYYPEIVPDDPVITREGTTVTITCATTTATIYYKLNEGGEYQIYTGPITVPRTVDVYSFAQDYRGRSYEVKDEAPEKPVKPATPVLTFSNNTITIVCETASASIYYMKEGGYWYEYTGPITITSADNGYYYTKSIKDYIESDISDRVWCEYSEEPVVVVPADPVITCSNNVVTITCSTSGATIYYSTDNGVTYNEYTGTITISADTTFYAYSELNGETSNTVSYEAQYEDSPQPVAPADPVISCNTNIVTITCSTSGAVIWYSTDGGNTYNIYTEPISISADTTFYAYSTKDGLTSNVVGPYEAEYVDNRPSQPIISCANNMVTITCSTPGADIYYLINDGYYNDGVYTLYTGPITVSADLVYYQNYITIYAYSSKNNLNSDQASQRIYIPIDVPTIEISNNIVTITGGDGISTFSYYKVNNGNWTKYTETFTVQEKDIIYARIVIEENGNYGNTVEKVNYNYSSIYLTYEILEDGTITLTSSTYKVIYYKKNNNSWSYITNEQTISVNTGDIIQLGGNNDQYGDTKLAPTGRFNAYGNIMSLISYNNFSSATSLPNNDVFSEFYKNTKIVSAKNLVLPATVLRSRCYELMFSGCTNLVYAPMILPATQLFYNNNNNYNCYAYMFERCTSLITAPILPATKLSSSCYAGMFSGCTSLIKAPELPATTLATSCYAFMFGGCTSLTTGPKSLPATTLQSNCYQEMFLNCTSLVNVPKQLPAKGVGGSCYESMFEGCISLKYAPTIPEITPGTKCCRRMFYGCSSLNYIKNLTTTFLTESYNCYTDWVNGVAASGKFYRRSYYWPTGNSGIPSGWRVYER